MTFEEILYLPLTPLVWEWGNFCHSEGGTTEESRYFTSFRMTIDSKGRLGGDIEVKKNEYISI